MLPKMAVMKKNKKVNITSFWRDNNTYYRGNSSFHSGGTYALRLQSPFTRMHTSDSDVVGGELLMNS
jgi:hypothetical protein